MKPSDPNAWTERNYESGGKASLPPHLRDGLRKCVVCGAIYVGSTLTPFPVCAKTKQEEKKWTQQQFY